MRIARPLMRVVLFVTALASLGCFASRREVDLGFKPHKVLALDVRPAQGTDSHRLIALYRMAATRLSRLPGVASASACDALPTDPPRKGVITVQGRPPAPKPILVNAYRVLPEYLRTIGIPLLKGRTFTDRDLEAPVSALVSELFAKKYFPDEDPIGKSFKVGDSDWLTIVGVTGDVGRQDEREPACYVLFAPDSPEQAVFVLQVASDRPGDFAEAARAEILQVDPAATLTEVGPLEQRSWRGVIHH